MGASAGDQVAGHSPGSCRQRSSHHPDVGTTLVSVREDSSKDDDEGLEALVELEKERGYVEAQQQVTTYLSSKVWIPLWDLLAERLASISPENSVVFLTRVAAMSPGIFHMSMLLDKMHGKTTVATVLFYPGSIEGTTGLRFMELKDRDALGNYRVKIYG